MSTEPGEPGRAAAPGLSNLQLRVISGVVLAVAVLSLTWVGGFPFRLLAAGIGALMFYEWATMARGGEPRAGQWLPAALLAAALIAIGLGVAAIPALLLIAGGAIVTIAAGRMTGEGPAMAIGLAYAALSCFALAFLRGGDTPGLKAVMFLFAVVWTTDILAYFVGRAVGGPKLAPSISPGKTWSGAVGGTIAGVVAGLAAAAAMGRSPGLLIGIAALLLSVVSQMGDLFESGTKRRFGVKDSSNLIPGHGGVMDRVDGLVAAALALYLIGWMAAGPDNPAHGIFPN